MSKERELPAAQDVESLRIEIARLKAEHFQITGAPSAREDMIGRLDAAIEKHGADYEPSLASIAKEGGLERALVSKSSSKYDDGAAASLRTACFLAPDKVRARYVALIDEYLKDHDPGLPAAERRAALKRVDRQISDLEISEELAITALEDGGQPLARRSDLDPAAFFEAHGREAGRERLLRLSDEVGEAHAALMQTNDRLGEARAEKAKLVSMIQGTDFRRFIGRADDGSPIYDNPWRDAKAKIDAGVDPEINRLAAGAERAQARWEPLAAVREKLQEFAEHAGIVEARHTHFVSQ